MIISNEGSRSSRAGSQGWWWRPSQQMCFVHCAGHIIESITDLFDTSSVRAPLPLPLAIRLGWHSVDIRWGCDARHYNFRSVIVLNNIHVALASCSKDPVLGPIHPRSNLANVLCFCRTGSASRRRFAIFRFRAEQTDHC